MRALTVLALAPLIFLLPCFAELNPNVFSSCEEEYLNLPEDKIDIAEGALIIAKGCYPELDIQKYINQIDAMANELKNELRDVTDPTELVRTINNYLFLKQEFLFKYDEAGKKGLRFLNDVLDNRCGCCVGLTILYLSVTDRLNLPFCGAHAPNHMFVRYDDGKTKINIETSLKGEVCTNQTYVIERGISSISIEKGLYLENLTDREVLTIILANRGGTYYEKGDYEKALKDYDKAISLNPEFVDAYNTRGGAYASKGNYDKAIQNYDKAISLNSKNAVAYYNRAAVYAFKKEKQNMLRDLKEAIELAPSFKNMTKGDKIFKDWWEDEDFKRIVE